MASCTGEMDDFWRRREWTRPTCAAPICTAPNWLVYGWSARFAARGEGRLLQGVQTSVEDWGRERLDEHEGYAKAGKKRSPNRGREGPD